jgi:hypothetical protein
LEGNANLGTLYARYVKIFRRWVLCASFLKADLTSLLQNTPSDLHKTLILANVRTGDNGKFTVEELAIATEHAPFRHKNIITEVGGQRKKAKLQNASTVEETKS